MGIFNINGFETDDFTEAMNRVRTVWHESKVDAVALDKTAALAKPTRLDVQRAEAGVSPDLTRATVRKG